MATTKKPNEEEVLLEEPVANPSLKINPTANYDKATATPYQAPTWNGGTGVGAQANRLAQKAINMNYTDWTKGTDYASLTKRYSQQGQKAMDNTLGMVAARTGGLASSYTTAAGNQAYNDYMTKLEDAARALYDSQRAQAVENYGIAQGMYNQQYAEYQDNRNFGYQQYQNNVNNAQWADTQYLNQYNTQWNQAFQESEANRNQSNINWEQNFQQGQYGDTRTEADELTLQEMLYYQPNLDYATYMQANPNSTITEAKFNEIKATAAGQYAENNKEWNYNTATKEEQDLYQAMYYSPDYYPNYAAYMQANPGSTMTESKFNQIKATATGQFSQDNAGTQQGYLTQEEQNLDATLYYAPDLYPDYASYKAANPNTQITEARFNEIKATALGRYENDNKAWNYETATKEEQDLYQTMYHSPETYSSYAEFIQAYPNSTINEAKFNQIKNTAAGQYANDNKEWTYNTANAEEQKLHDAIYANPEIYADYNAYKQAFPNSTMTESTFNQIKSTAEGQYAIDQQGRNDAQAAQDKQDAQSAILTQLQANPDAKLSEEDMTNAGWSEATINAYRDIYREVKKETEGQELSEAENKANATLTALIAEGLSWDEIKNDPQYAEAIQNATFGEAYWQKKADNLSREQNEEKATNEIHTILQQNPAANIDAETLRNSGMSEAMIFALRSYYGDIQGKEQQGQMTETQQKADNNLLTLISSGLTWEEIKGNDKYYNYVRNSSFGDDYWQKMADGVAEGEAEENQAKAQEEFLTQVTLNPTAPIDPALAAATGWSQATIDAYVKYYTDQANLTEGEQISAEAEEANQVILTLISSGLTWEQIKDNPDYAEYIEASNYKDDYWTQMGDNVQDSLYKEEATNEIKLILQQNPAAILDSDLIEKSGMSEAAIFAWRDYYGQLQGEYRNAQQSEKQMQADNVLLQLISSGMSWEDIKNNDKYYSYVRNSTFGDDYWEKTAENVSYEIAKEAQPGAQEEILTQLAQNPTAKLDPELVAKSGWSQATINAYKQHYLQAKQDDAAADKDSAKTEADNGLLNLIASGMSWNTIKNNPKYSQWVTDSNYGEDYWTQMADNVATEMGVAADAAADVAQYFANGGNLNTMPDDIRALVEKSGLTETQLRQMYENAGYSNANLKAQEQMIVQFSQGMFPENEVDLWKLVQSTGWDIATVNAYQSYYEDLANAKSDEESLKVDSKLMELVGAGESWDQITAEYGDIIENSTFGESYWKNKIRQYAESQGFTSSQLIAQDDLQTYLAAGTKLDPDKYTELVKKSGRSGEYWKAYAKLARGGEVTESDVPMLTDIEEIDIWSEAILGDGAQKGAQTYEKAERYATRLAQLDPELAAELLDEWERKHGYTSPDTSTSNTPTGGKVGTGGSGVAGDPAIPKPFG